MKVIPVTVYIIADVPGYSNANWHVMAGPDVNSCTTYSAPELGEAVKLAVTDKFTRMAVEAMGEER